MQLAGTLTHRACLALSERCELARFTRKRGWQNPKSMTSVRENRDVARDVPLKATLTADQSVAGERSRILTRAAEHESGAQWSNASTNPWTCLSIGCA